MTADSNDTRVADAPAGNWVDRRAPAAWLPYMRLARFDRPIGWRLLLWPCWWSAALAAIAAGWPYPNPWHIALFMIGAIVMRGAGCTWNDIVDRDYDGRVERTRSRPIPSGAVTARQAAVFMVALGLVGFLVLIQFNTYAILLGVASLVTIVIYPLMKRFTWWPQFFLGLAFNWGTLMGWAAAFGRIDAPAILLYVGGIAWTIGYDTIYAHQDKEDDALIGVKSTARLFAGNSQLWISVFYAIAIVLFGGAIITSGGGVLALTGLAGAALHAAWQVATIDIDDPDRCLMLFKSNRGFGWILFVGLLAEAAMGAV